MVVIITILASAIFGTAIISTNSNTSTNNGIAGVLGSFGLTVIIWIIGYSLWATYVAYLTIYFAVARANLETN